MTIEEQISQEGKHYGSKKRTKSRSKAFSKDSDMQEVVDWLFSNIPYDNESADPEKEFDFENIRSSLRDKITVTITKFIEE